MKKILLIVFSVVFISIGVWLLPLDTEATDFVDGGSCGDGMIWHLNSDGVLSISGNGPIW